MLFWVYMQSDHVLFIIWSKSLLRHAGLMMSAFPSQQSQIWLSPSVSVLGAGETKQKRAWCPSQCIRKARIISARWDLLRCRGSAVGPQREKTWIQKGAGHGLGVPEELVCGLWLRLTEEGGGGRFRQSPSSLRFLSWTRLNQGGHPRRSMCYLGVAPARWVWEDLGSGSHLRPGSVTLSKSLNLFQGHIALCRLVQWS